MIFHILALGLRRVTQTCTSTGLQDSIVIGEGRDLDHWNRLHEARIFALDNFFKALNVGFCDFLSCIWTPKLDPKDKKSQEKRSTQDISLGCFRPKHHQMGQLP
jgi:hypothetical protein